MLRQGFKTGHNKWAVSSSDLVFVLIRRMIREIVVVRSLGETSVRRGVEFILKSQDTVLIFSAGVNQPETDKISVPPSSYDVPNHTDMKKVANFAL